ncbi:unnamed protein product [Acanthoscelides obtectus]|uniref:Uncharacterized protein n=1 Tax=Acanthoscelides obtectus TaxID=200917 RepID=A0A9P0LAA0_ACAOB|nr:unnamed protein product [Acanthoscelides obtectus]CAK1630854.1 hypothetical protein AOBTE_LOCUS6589 [Acanthoscelides obtectus]
MFAEQMLMKMQRIVSGLTLNISASSWHVVLEFASRTCRRSS